MVVRRELAETGAAEAIDALEQMPEAVRRAASRVRATAVVQIPVTADGHALGSLELMRAGVSFDEGERRIGRFAAGQAALAIRALRGDGDPGAGPGESARGL